MFKKIIRTIIFRPFIASKIVTIALKCHNFSYKLAGYFSPHLEPSGLHPKHRLLDYHNWFKSKLKPDWRVLDIGCGNGSLAVDMRKSCAHVTAIDMNKANIEKARANYAKEGIAYICGDATTYTFDSGYDAIVLSNVLEHINDRIGFFKRLPIGSNTYLLIRVPLLDRDWITLYKKERCIEWRLDKTHFVEYTLDTLKRELADAGLVFLDYKIQFGELYGVVRKK